MFGAGMDPVPFISSAYGIALVALASYGFWQLRLRRQLRQLEQAALSAHKRSSP